MKKYIINTLYFFAIILFVSSCKKVFKSQDSGVPDFVQKARMLAAAAGADSSVFDNYVAIVSVQLANSINRDSSYQTSAYARVSENGVPVNVGPLILNNKTILPGLDNLYAYNYSITEGKSLFGTTVQTQISDSAVNTSVTKTTARLRNVVMTVPKEIFPVSIKFPKGVVDRNLNDTIKWSPDPMNQFGKIQITVSYYKGISQFNSINMPLAIANLSYTVTDNGTFVIPKADLSRFPQGAYIGISIARAWVDNTTSKIAFISIVEAHTVPLLVIDTYPPLAIISTNVTVDKTTLKLSANSIVNGGKSPFKYLWTITPTPPVPDPCPNCYRPILQFTTQNVSNGQWYAGCGGRYTFTVTDATGKTLIKNGLIYF